MLFAVKVKQILSQTILVEAGSFEDAVRKASEYNSDVGLDPEEIVGMEYEKSEFSNEDGSATTEQADDAYMLRI